MTKRMMRRNQSHLDLGFRNKHSLGDHEETPGCEVPPACLPVASMTLDEYKEFARFVIGRYFGESSVHYEPLMHQLDLKGSRKFRITFEYESPGREHPDALPTNARVVSHEEVQD